MNTVRNIEKLKQKYDEYAIDRSIHHGYLSHINYHFEFGEYTVSVIQEPNYKGENDLEYAIIHEGELVHLFDEGDCVARFKTHEEVERVIEHFKQEAETNE